MADHGRHNSVVQWSATESQRLLTLVDEHGKKWLELASHFPDRNPTQLRNRYLRIVKGRQRVEAGTARNLCRLCGEIRSSHICKGRSATDAKNDVAIMHRVQATYKAKAKAAAATPAATHSRNKVVAKQSAQGRRMGAQRREPQRASWLPAVTGSTRDYSAILDFIEGGIEGVYAL